MCICIQIDYSSKLSELLLSNRVSHILLQSLINTRRMYKLATLTTVMLLLLLPGGHGEGQEVKVDQAQCEAACDMGIYYDGCKCFRQVVFFSVCLKCFRQVLFFILYFEVF